MAASNTIVDLSEDNDNAGTLAAVAALPSSNPSDAFERSCDNPECSAPKLIAQVPKRDTSEFITEPMVMNQPTLINGFTTVFQIDGVGTRMEDLMKESEAAENALGGQNHKPKTVFRVVPNTHAHIVNYVVVDAAGDTMRKIKANDPETIRKLLVSQRLSADQMLKKLIGKALETPTRTENPSNAPISLSGPAPVLVPGPMKARLPMKAPATLKASSSMSGPAPKLATLPVSAPVLAPASYTASSTVTTSTAPISVLAAATKTASAHKPTPGLKSATSLKSTALVKPAPQLKPVLPFKPAPAVKPVPLNKQAPAPKLTFTPKPTPVTLSTSAPISDLTSVPSRNDVSTPKLPPGITIKLLSNLDAQKTPSPTPPPTSSVVNSPPNRQIPKSLSSLIQNASSAPSQPTPAAQTTPSQTATVGRVISASKPVVWQAVPPALASKLTPVKIITPGTPAAVSPQNVIPVVISPPKMTPSLIPSPSQQPALKETEMFDVEKSIPATSLTIHRSPNESPPNPQSNILKRKLDSISRIPEAIKRLRPRSPNRVQNPSPLAGNVSCIKDSPPSTKKLPTLPKYQKPPISNRTAVTIKKVLPAPKAEEDAVTTPVTVTLPESVSNETDIEEENTSTPSLPTLSDTPLRRKGRHLMGPASKMKARKAISDAKSQALQDAPSETKQPLISETKSMKIEETVITQLSTESQESSQPAEIITKPCSVAITDIVKSSATTDSDSDSKTKRSKPNLRSFDKEKPLSTEINNQPKVLDKLRGRWAIKRQENEKAFVRSPRTTRSKVTTPRPSTETAAASDEIPDSTLLTSPSAPTRVLRVVLPSQKNGIVNNPATSPHPNLKISSVISSGTALSATLEESDTDSVPVIVNDDSSGPGIEQLQKELADLRRTVDRLTQGKKV